MCLNRQNPWHIQNQFRVCTCIWIESNTHELVNWRCISCGPVYTGGRAQDNSALRPVLAQLRTIGNHAWAGTTTKPMEPPSVLDRFDRSSAPG
jgi:hypothetical protein